VILCEKNPDVAAAWRFLLSKDAAEWIARLPNAATIGDNVENMVPNAPAGLLTIMRAECNHGTAGTNGKHKLVTKFGQKGWPRLKPRLLYWLPRIAHWQIIEGSYENLPNIEATWFVDPPYNNPAGRRYVHHALDFMQLADWCERRVGQIIVCENAGADWLPFNHLIERQGIRSRYQKSNASEVVYVKN
jgi:hypothetical protein